MFEVGDAAWWGSVPVIVRYKDHGRSLQVEDAFTTKRHWVMLSRLYPRNAEQFDATEHALEPHCTDAHHWSSVDHGHGVWRWHCAHCPETTTPTGAMTQ